jgi:hypothetical protein
MSKQIDAFCDNLRNKLNEMDARLEQLKTSAQTRSAKVDESLKAQAASVRTKIDAGHDSVEAAKTRMKTWAESKKADADQKVAAWKAERNEAHLKRRADAAEEYAADAFAVAVADVDEAHAAAVEAVLARIDADAAATPVKQSA